MKRSLTVVICLLLFAPALLFMALAQEGLSTRPATATTEVADCLKCSFSKSKDKTILVNWEFRNLSSNAVWIPIKFSVTEGHKPKEALPFMFLVPGARLMGVAAMFSELPDSLGIDEGAPLAELVRVAPGDTISGISSVPVPFTWKDPAPNRPNPFTPWGAGNYKVAIDQTEIRRVESFQIAVQVFRLSEALVQHYKAKYPAGDGHVIVSDCPPVDKVKGCEDSGKYWASSLAKSENRRPRIGDFADWAVSPVYKVDWAVGSHPPIGLRN